MEEIRKKFIERIKSIYESYYTKADLSYWSPTVYDKKGKQIELPDDEAIKLLISELESTIRKWHSHS